MSEVELGEYATDDGLYFSFDNCVYVTKGNGWSAGDVGVMRWDDGGSRWMAAETMVEALELPPRPLPPSEPFMTSANISLEERVQAAKNYMRRMEMYVDALHKRPPPRCWKCGAPPRKVK